MCWQPHLAAVGGDQRGAVARLHRCVRKKGRAVHRLDFFHRAGDCRERIAFIAQGVGGAGIDLHCAFDAGQVENLVAVKTFEAAAIDRAAHHRCVQHAGQVQINCVDFAAVEFVSGVEALERFAGQLPVLRALELNRFGIRRGEF